MKSGFGIAAVLDGEAIVADEAVASVVESQPELSVAGHRFDFQGVGPEPPVAAGGFHRSAFRMFRVVDSGRPANAIGKINPVVEGERRTVDEMLGRSLLPIESGQHDPPNVRAAIAIGIFQVQDVRGAGDEHPAAPGQNAAGKVDAGGILVAAVEITIAIRILEQRDAAEGRFALRNLIGIAAAFGDEHATLFIKSDGHGRDDEWLRGSQLDPQPGFNFERGQRLLRRKGTGDRDGSGGRQARQQRQRSGSDQREDFHFN